MRESHYNIQLCRLLGEQPRGHTGSRGMMKNLCTVICDTNATNVLTDICKMVFDNLIVESD